MARTPSRCAPHPVRCSLAARRGLAIRASAVAISGTALGQSRRTGGDWLDRFGALLGDEGRWSAREVRPAVAVPAPSDPERLLGRTLDLPNAVWRLRGMTATTTRCLMLAFRYTAVSDEKREGLVWLGFNLGTGAVVNDILARLRPALAQIPDWQAPDQAAKLAAGPGWSAATLTNGFGFSEPM